jgi:phytoene dehydrogenase-like protein
LGGKSRDAGMVDAIVIGAGPNGLVAAATMARHGWKVLVLEAKERPGGAVYSEQSTLPGFWHDIGAAFFPFADDSPAFQFLDLPGAGLQWANARRESCHPALDGSCVAIARDVDLAASTFGPDESAWRRLAGWRQRMGKRLAGALLAPLPAFGQAWRLGPYNVLKLGMAGLQTPARFARRCFQSEAARRVVPALALHVDLGPEDFAGTGLGLVLALLAAKPGFRVPLGGARAITDALLRRLDEHAGEVRLRCHVDQVIVRQKRACAVRVADGTEIEARHAILADVTAPALYLKLVPTDHMPGWIRRSIKRFRFGWGTFKMDWALSAPVPWNAVEARESAVVHSGENVDDLIRFTRQARAGHLPDNPYLVIGQQSLIDPSRAPPGCHTLWAYSRVPNAVDSGWKQAQEAFADRIEERIEGLAPGFRTLIRSRAIRTPEHLESMNENLVGGDLGGGSARFSQQLFFRPMFPYFRHRTPIRNLYLASASAHPGAGVHGACGFNAAQIALRDHGVRLQSEVSPSHR